MQGKKEKHNFCLFFFFFCKSRIDIFSSMVFWYLWRKNLVCFQKQENLFLERFPGKPNATEELLKLSFFLYLYIKYVRNWFFIIFSQGHLSPKTHLWLQSRRVAYYGPFGQRVGLSHLRGTQMICVFACVCVYLHVCVCLCLLPLELTCSAAGTWNRQVTTAGQDRRFWGWLRGHMSFRL